MKNLYLFLAFFFFIAQSFCQVSLTATAGLPGPVNYATLKSAFDAINAGTHQGAINIGVSGTITETAPAILNASGVGAANFASVFIGPASLATITGNLTSSLVRINGAQNVTIDGRIGATGTTRSLTLQNTSTASTASTTTIRFINDAAMDTVRYVNIEGSGRSNGSGTVLFSNTTGSLGNRQILISNNDIGAVGINVPVNAIYSIGQSASATNNNITISGNSIHDFFNPASQSVGIYVNTNNSNWTISGNSLFQTAARINTGNNASFFYISISSGNGHVVSNNFIGGSTVNAGGSPAVHNSAFINLFRGILLSVGSVTASSIDGNTITNLDLSAASTSPQAFFSGITVLSGMVDVGLTAGNVVGSSIGTGAITYAITNTANSTCYGIFSRLSTVNMRNNIVGSITLNASSTGLNVFTGIECSNHRSLVNIESNAIGGTSANSIQTNGVNNSILGIALYSDSALSGITAVVSNNTIKNLTNNGAAPYNVSVYGIVNNISNDITMNSTISDNVISDLNSPSAGATIGDLVGIGLYSNSPSASTDATINGNQIHDFNAGGTGNAGKLIGIDQEALFPNFLNISNNTIHTLTAASNYIGISDGAANGIRILKSGAGTFNMFGNTIHNIECTGSGNSIQVIGIGCEYENASANIYKNKIFDLRNPNASSSGSISGLLLRGIASAGTFNVFNNMISLSPSNVPTYGTCNNQDALQVNLYHNSVFLNGTATGANNSAAFYRSGVNNNTTIHSTDNIFYNTTNGGTGTHFAIMNDNAIPATGWVTTGDYNDLYTANASAVAFWGNSSFSLSQFQSASGGDGNSTSTIVYFIDPPAGDLHLDIASFGDPDLLGVPIGGITDDFDGDFRSPTTPYIGADESLLIILGVEVEFFKGIKQNNNNALNWKVNCNSASINFVVQRSVDGKIFESLGEITATGTRCAQPFDFIDDHPVGKINYYRLKIIEEDGVVAYSTNVAILNHNKFFVGMAPTLVNKGTAVLSIISSEKTTFDIIVISIEGRMIQKQKIVVEAGTNKINLDLSNLASGCYSLTGYTTEGFFQTMQFVKQ